MLVGAIILTVIVAGTNIVNYVDLCSQADATTVCLLLDCAHDMDRFHSYLGTSIAAAVLGLIAVFAFVALLAPIVLRPVVESYEKQRRFVTDASHEIKTPLAVIDAADEVLEIDGGQNEWTQSIHHEVARLAALTEQLVVLSSAPVAIKSTFCSSPLWICGKIYPQSTEAAHPQPEPPA